MSDIASLEIQQHCHRLTEQQMRAVSADMRTREWLQSRNVGLSDEQFGGMAESLKVQSGAHAPDLLAEKHGCPERQHDFVTGREGVRWTE